MHKKIWMHFFKKNERVLTKYEKAYKLMFVSDYCFAWYF